MWRSTRSTDARIRQRLGRFATCGLLVLQLAGRGLAEEPACHTGIASLSDRYTRSEARYAVPALTLTGANGEPVALASVLGGPGPVLLQFVFTTCTTVCPTLAGIFRAVQNEAGVTRLVSISIDPETDTPARLREWAASLGAGERWSFLTGRREDVEAVERAFDVYRGNKMLHPPAIFLHAGDAPPGNAPWVRLEGYPSAAELKAELARLPAPPVGDPALGRRIYRDGVLPSGEPLAARLAGDVPASGKAVACAGCHRRSGYGGVEGLAYVPPVTGPLLFSAHEPRRVDLFEKLFQEPLAPSFWTQLRERASRPAYDETSLARALREGVDPLARSLHPLMPRYDLDDAGVAHLAAYLRTLSATSSPGADGKTLRFATVVAEGADAARAASLREVIAAYVRFRNANVERLRARQGRLAWEDEQWVETYRQWQVDVWSLSGPRKGWPEQLLRQQRERPVLALLSGLAPGDWRPIHQFCEEAELPCIFPETDLPPPEPSQYNLYFSPGIRLEAEALAQQLKVGSISGERPRIVQVYRAGTAGERAAGVLREAWGGEVESLRLGADEPGLPRLAEQLGLHPQPAVLVLWLSREDLAGLDTVVASLGAAAGSRVTQVFVSSTLAGEDPPPLPAVWQDRGFALRRFGLPGKEPPHAFRVRAWLHARGIARADERAAFDTYFTLTAVDDALSRMIDHFSRDLLIEILEREVESSFNPGVYPRLSLGPGQRFAAKGCYVLKLAPGHPGGVESKGDWVVP